MNTSSVQIKEPVPIRVETGDREAESSPAIVSKPRGLTLFAVPVATLMALAVHGFECMVRHATTGEQLSDNSGTPPHALITRRRSA